MSHKNMQINLTGRNTHCRIEFCFPCFSTLNCQAHWAMSCYLTKAYLVLHQRKSSNIKGVAQNPPNSTPLPDWPGPTWKALGDCESCRASNSSKDCDSRTKSMIWPTSGTLQETWKKRDGLFLFWPIYTWIHVWYIHIHKQMFQELTPCQNRTPNIREYEVPNLKCWSIEGRIPHVWNYHEVASTWTWNPKWVWKMIFIFNCRCFLRFHLNFPGFCKSRVQRIQGIQGNNWTNPPDPDLCRSAIHPIDLLTGTFHASA